MKRNKKKVKEITINFKKPKSKKDIIALPFIDYMFYDNNEWWIFFSRGYKSEKTTCGLIHENTIEGCIDTLMNGVKKVEENIN